MSAASIALVGTYEDHMTKTPTSKETKVQQKTSKSGAGELRDDDLQEVAGGLAVNTPTVPVTPVCVSKL